MATAPSLTSTLKTSPKDVGALEKAVAASSAGPLLEEAKATLKQWREHRAAQASAVAQALAARDVPGLTAALQAFEFVEDRPQNQAKDCLAQWTPQYEKLKAETKKALALRNVEALKSILEELQSLRWANDDWAMEANRQLLAWLPTYESQRRAVAVSLEAKDVAGLKVALDAWTFRRTDVKEVADMWEEWKAHLEALLAQAKRMTKERDVRGLQHLHDLWQYHDTPPEFAEAMRCLQKEAPKYQEACAAIRRHVDAHDLRRLNAVLQGWRWPEEPLVKDARVHQKRWQGQMDQQLSDIRHCIDAKDPAGLEAALGRWEFPVEDSSDHFEVLRARRVLSAWLGGYHAAPERNGFPDPHGPDRLTEDDFARCRGQDEFPAYYEKLQSAEAVALETRALASSLSGVEEGVAVAS